MSVRNSDSAEIHEFCNIFVHIRPTEKYNHILECTDDP